jgi:AcrR family transcriptional regulator
VHSLERPHRRRGDVLVDAIHTAVMSELAGCGYDALTIERVAERAQTGKASIYRRWPTKLELVLDALDASMPSVGAVPDTGAVRSDLLVVLRRMAKHMNSRTGSAMRACMSDVKQHEELAAAVREHVIAPRTLVMRDVLSRGIERGEVHPGVLTDRVVELGPMLLHAEQLRRGGLLRDQDVVAIVDEVLIPLLRPRPT